MPNSPADNLPANSLQRPHPMWVWPLHISAKLSWRLLRIADRASRLFDHRWWPVLCLIIGAIPAGVSFLLCVRFANELTAVLAVPVILGAVRRDLTWRGWFALVLIVVGHCGVNITLAAWYPERLSVILPQGLRYWQESRAWIETGINSEYELRSWIPAHLQLAAGLLPLAYLSWGLIPVAAGFEQCDMMNFYVGRLIAESSNPWVAGGLGWHPWSLCRGIGAVFLILEMTSWSVERFTGERLSSTARRRQRWVWGVTFLAVDALMKATLTEHVRQILAAGLHS
ncbi:MAG: hypothetical protein ACKV2Q_13595 [Planctomycetaceae bacterium]